MRRLLVLLVGGAWVVAHMAGGDPLAKSARAYPGRRLPAAGASVFEYATYLGRESVATAVAVDAAGNAYVTGTTSSMSFHTTAGVRRSRRTQRAALT